LIYRYLLDIIPVYFTRYTQMNDVVQKLVVMLIVVLFYLLSSFVIIKFYTSNYGRKIFLIHRDSKLCISICPYMSDMCNISNNVMQVLSIACLSVSQISIWLSSKWFCVTFTVCLQCVNRYLCYVLRHLVREML